MKKSDSIFVEKVCLWLYAGCDCAVVHVSREITLEVKKNISGKGSWSLEVKSYNSESVGYFFPQERRILILEVQVDYIENLSSSKKVKSIKKE